MRIEPAPGFPGYFVSEDGRLLSSKLGELRELRTAPNLNGYHRYRFCVRPPRSASVHALVAEAFLGPRPQGAQINHRDGNKQNNAAANLEYVTPSQNIQHALATGLWPLKTECIRGHKFTDENTSIERNGHRHCRACKRLRDRAYRAAKKKEGT